MKINKGDKVRVKYNNYNDFKETDIEKELTSNYTYIVEEIGLGLGLVRLKGFIPLVRTSFLKIVKK
jgi:hypothetical protein